MGELLPGNDLQSVVVGAAIEQGRIDLAEVRIRPGAGIRTRQSNLIDVPAQLNIESAVPHVANVQHHSMGELMLNVQLLLRIVFHGYLKRRVVHVETVEQVRRPGLACGIDGERWPDPKIRTIEIGLPTVRILPVCSAIAQLEDRRIRTPLVSYRNPSLPPGRRWSNGVLPGKNIVDTESSANRPVVLRRPCHSDSWGKEMRVRVGHGRVPVLAAIPHRAQRAVGWILDRRLEARDSVLHLAPTALGDPTHSQSQRQIRFDLVFILNESLSAPHPSAGLGVDRNPPLIRQAKKEVCITFPFVRNAARWECLINRVLREHASPPEAPFYCRYLS